METVAKTNFKTSTSDVSKSEAKTKTSEFWKKAEENRFGYTPMILLITGIIGGIAAASGIIDSWIQLAAVAFPSTILLALILSVAPMRAIYIGALIALVMDLLVIIF